MHANIHTLHTIPCVCMLCMHRVVVFDVVVPPSGIRDEEQEGRREGQQEVNRGTNDSIPVRGSGLFTSALAVVVVLPSFVPL